jgi:hypothetical protein
MKIIIIFVCLIWESLYLYHSSKRFIITYLEKEIVPNYPVVSFKEQILVIGIIAELINSGIHPSSSINAGIQMLDVNKRRRYQEYGKEITKTNDDYLLESIRFVNQSSILGSTMYETLKLNIETYQRNNRSNVLKSIKKLEVWMLGPLGLCFLPTFMLIAVVPLIGSLISGFIS